MQDIDVAQSSIEVDLDDLIPTAVEGSDTDSVANALEPDVVADADSAQWSGDEDVVSEAGSAVEEESNFEEPVELIVPQGRLLRDALIALDGWSLQELVSKRAVMMKNIPRVVKGPFRNALQLALEEATATVPPRTGMEIISPSASHGRQVNGDEERRAKAELLVGMGELSSARQALEGAELAPGTNETLQMLSDHSKRPPEIREPLPAEVSNHVSEVPFELSEKIFLENLRTAKRGAAAGSSGHDHGTFACVAR